MKQIIIIEHNSRLKFKVLLIGERETIPMFFKISGNKSSLYYVHFIYVLQFYKRLQTKLYQTIIKTCILCIVFFVCSNVHG